MAVQEISPMLEWTTARIGGVELRLAASEAGLRSIEFSPDHAIDGYKNAHQPLLSETERQLRAYFAGDLRDFDLPLDMVGTPFQQRVWRALLQIPYGRTRSYSEIARGIGAPSAVRAVGAANGANPIPIVVPCHRVIGAGGNLVGYGGGLPLKQRLLALESGGLFEAYET
jgi:methylated-DNA-[protein]-cysteine S-methyltransferase